VFVAIFVYLKHASNQMFKDFEERFPHAAL
jgi:hypothetical protein